MHCLPSHVVAAGACVLVRGRHRHRHRHRHPHHVGKACMTQTFALEDSFGGLKRRPVAGRSPVASPSPIHPVSAPGALSTTTTTTPTTASSLSQWIPRRPTALAGRAKGPSFDRPATPARRPQASPPIRSPLLAIIKARALPFIPTAARAYKRCPSPRFSSVARSPPPSAPVILFPAVAQLSLLPPRRLFCNITTLPWLGHSPRSPQPIGAPRTRRFWTASDRLRPCSVAASTAKLNAALSHR